MDLLFRQDAYLQDCTATVTAADDTGIRLDRTVFYPTGGGQPGDTGALILADGSSITIIDTLKGETPDAVRHIPAPDSVLPAVGAQVTARIDWARRHRLMRMHTCLHLVCALIKGDVTGGQVSDGKGRLDFNLPENTLDKDQLTAELNALIAANHVVQSRWISDDELAATPELVRTMSVKPPSGQGKVRLLEIVGVDLQPCGGTHVARTAEIGRVEITKIENKGKMNRRVNITLLDA
jgi:misacylated tRNA(Ala) deacylase